MGPNTVATNIWQEREDARLLNENKRKREELDDNIDDSAAKKQNTSSSTFAQIGMNTPPKITNEGVQFDKVDAEIKVLVAAGTDITLSTIANCTNLVERGYGTPATVAAKEDTTNLTGEWVATLNKNPDYQQLATEVENKVGDVKTAGPQVTQNVAPGDRSEAKLSAGVKIGAPNVSFDHEASNSFSPAPGQSAG